MCKGTPCGNQAMNVDVLAALLDDACRPEGRVFDPDWLHEWAAGLAKLVEAATPRAD